MYISRNRKKQCGHLRCSETCRFGPKEKKRTTIRRVGVKREEEDKKYFPLREQFLKDHPKCGCGRNGCKRKSQDVHHKKGRGKYYLDVSTWLAVARICHDWIGAHPEESMALGLIESRLT